jgi:hypothetical protein
MGQTANSFGISELTVPSLSQSVPAWDKNRNNYAFSYKAEVRLEACSVDAGTSDTRTNGGEKAGPAKYLAFRTSLL